MFVTFFFVAVFYSLFLSGFLKISNINIIQVNEISESNLRNELQKEMTGKYFNYIEKNNFLIINTKKIKNILNEKFKQAENIIVEKKFPDTLNIFLNERESALNFCRDSCYIIDKNGYAFDKSNQIYLNKFIVLNDGSKKELIEGEIVLKKEYIKYIISIKKYLKDNLDIEIEKEINTPQVASGDIRVKTINGWLIYFDYNISIDKEIEMLRVVLKNEIEKSNQNDLEYIDLRTNNKVYYKLKNQESEENNSKEESNDEEVSEKDKKKKKD